MTGWGKRHPHSRTCVLCHAAGRRDEGLSLWRPLESKVHLPQSQEAPRARRDHVPDSYPRTPEAGRWDDGGSGSGPALLWLALGLRACQGRTASSEDGWPGAPHCPRSVPPPATRAEPRPRSGPRGAGGHAGHTEGPATVLPVAGNFTSPFPGARSGRCDIAALF